MKKNWKLFAWGYPQESCGKKDQFGAFWWKLVLGDLKNENQLKKWKFSCLHQQPWYWPYCMQDKWVFVFHEEGIQLPMPSQIWKNDRRHENVLCVLEYIQYPWSMPCQVTPSGPSMLRWRQEIWSIQHQTQIIIHSPQVVGYIKVPQARVNCKKH